MNVPFTEKMRKKYLEEWNLMIERRDELELQELGGYNPDNISFQNEITEIFNTLMSLNQKYREGIPRIPISRCPFTNELVLHSLDIYGIDGLWWNYDVPIRPEETLPITFHTMSGAISLTQPVEKALFVVRPGPGVPFIIPGLLAEPSVLAVISSQSIGPHTGYVICYYSNDPESVDFTVNSWGASERLDGYGVSEGGWSNRELMAEEMDFNLEPWIQSKKLGWISPDDSNVCIKTSLDDCPYLHIPGIKKLQMIFNGKVA